MIKLREGLAVNPDHVVSIYLRLDTRSLEETYDLRIKLTNADHWVKQNVGKDEAFKEMNRILELI